MKVEKFQVKEVNEHDADLYNNALTLDYSGSMHSDISSLQKACEAYISNKNDADYVSVIKFDDSLALECPLSKDKTELMKKAKLTDGLKYFGRGTALYAAIDEGLISLDKAGKNKQMILFTDGYENSSVLHFGNRAVFAQQVAKKARDNKIKINAISLGSNVNEKLLKFLSILTGGNYYNVTKSNTIVDVLNEMNLLARNYYVITYKPSSGDGEKKVRFGIQ